MDLCKDFRTIHSRRDASTPPKNGSPQKVAVRSRRARASFPLQIKTTEQKYPPPTHTTTSSIWKWWRSSLRSAQRRGATELCTHRLASRSVSHNFLVTWRKRHEHYRQHAQYEHSHTDGLCRVTLTAIAPRSHFLFLISFSKFFRYFRFFHLFFSYMFLHVFLFSFIMLGHFRFR